MSALDRYYRLLELEPGATLEEVNQAYKDLAFIWHPDRVPKDNPRLYEKAQKKLQEINEAREKLRSYPGYHQTSANWAAHKASHKTSPPPQQTHSTHHQTSAHKTSPPPQQTQTSAHKTSPPPQQKSDLSGRDFSQADLKGRDLSGRNMSNANLSGADLSDSFMHKVNLRGANLSSANLFRANLLLSDMREANLREANLIGADLSGADLRGADFTGARMMSGDRLLVKLVGSLLTGAVMPDGTIHG